MLTIGQHFFSRLAKYLPADYYDDVNDGYNRLVQRDDTKKTLLETQDAGNMRMSFEVGELKNEPRLGLIVYLLLASGKGSRVI